MSLNNKQFEQVGGVFKRKVTPPRTAPLIKFLRTAIFQKI
ncbi:hypothetical protein appser12_8020 [Actinobacillus pleuropneumoniae serovar 12 str. 1096]|nr:hypothetical protein appser12_8020 [Actinobacillus pleuropneumoniae serovar 12 str. 1096]